MPVFDIRTQRPSITDETFLNELYEKRVFAKKLDIWAYCVAYALANNLEPTKDHGTKMGSDLVHLDEKILDILEAAVICSHSEEDMDDEKLLNLMSSYASAGIQKLRQKFKNKSRTELYEIILSI